MTNYASLNSVFYYIVIRWNNYTYEFERVQFDDGGKSFAEKSVHMENSLCNDFYDRGYERRV